jgi:hypothetical protein
VQDWLAVIFGWGFCCYSYFGLCFWVLFVVRPAIGVAAILVVVLIFVCMEVMFRFVIGWVSVFSVAFRVVLGL